MLKKIFLNTYLIICFLLISSVTIILFSCGNSGDNNNNYYYKTGVFKDSAVRGISFSASSNSGTTNDKGEFQYKEGEIIQFYIGNSYIGKSTGKNIVTPIDIVPEAEDENNPTVTNIMRFIQMLDKDGVPDNGIFIDDNVLSELKNTPTIDFAINTDTFGQDSMVTDCIDNLNNKGLFENKVLLPKPLYAQSHYATTSYNQEEIKTARIRLDNKVYIIQYDIDIEKPALENFKITDEHGEPISYDRQVAAKLFNVAEALTVFNSSIRDPELGWEILKSEYTAMLNLIEDFTFNCAVGTSGILLHSRTLQTAEIEAASSIASGLISAGLEFNITKCNHWNSEYVSFISKNDCGRSRDKKNINNKKNYK
jgi:hypothetical protein